MVFLPVEETSILASRLHGVLTSAGALISANVSSATANVLSMGGSSFTIT
jgi:hypothetical protein